MLYSTRSLFTLFIGTALIASVSAAQPQRPNVVLILADDLGIGDVGYHVRTVQKKEVVVETPHLDALAQQSLWFTDGHSATSLCSPTRYSVMSGNNNFHSSAPWGTWGTFRESALRRGEATLGSVMQDAGYRTGFIGKWHLSSDFRNTQTGDVFRSSSDKEPNAPVDLTKIIDRGPRFCGFDYDFTLPCGIQGPIYLCYENQQWFPMHAKSEILYLNKERAINPKDLTSKGPGMGDSHWNTETIGDLISKKAADFIHESAGKEEPFFLYYCSPMVHLPHCPPEAFDGQSVAGTTPSLHTDMVVEFDLQVKRITEALKATGTFENTLFIITSDNGGLHNNGKTLAAGHNSSGGWSGSKNSPLEGGHRVPFFALWPGKIEPGYTAELAVNTDMVATLAALAGTKVPEGQALDSNNLLPLLLGKTRDYHSRETLFLQAGSQYELMFRKAEWKLILQSGYGLKKFEPIALYNLEENPTENPQANYLDDAAQQNRLQAMLTEYLQVRQSGQSTLPHRP